MGGVLNINYHCCIEDSTFNKSQKENIETVEQKAMDMGDKAIDKMESLISDFSPSRQHSTN